MPKKKFTKSTVVLCKLLLALTFLLVCATYSYATGPAGYSEYYIPGDEGNMFTIFNTLDALGVGSPMHTIITVTAWSDNTTIYYDHWENGYNFDPANPSTADETYTLNQGQSMTFESGAIGLPRTIGTPPATTCNNYRNRVSVGSSTNCYDGGDHIYVAGGVVTVTRGSYIEGVGIGTQAVAWEIYPIKPQLATYVLPFGENQGFWDFNRVFVLVQATEDNTTVTVDLNGDGAPDILNINRDATWNNAGDGTTVTLNKGQTFLLDSTSACPSHANCTTAASNQLPAGAVIQGNKTLQVKYIAGQPNQNCVARGFSAFPRGFWTKDYYAPLDQPTTAGRGNTDYYLYNPNSSAITVTWESRTTSGSFSIPAGSTVSYRALVPAGVPVDSGLYFKGTDVFWGVGVGDAGNHLYEWGFSLLPSTMLFNEHFLGWAPDDNTTAANAAPSAPTVSTDMGIFLTAAQDNTTVFIDNGIAVQTYTLGRLQTQFIVDPNDGDLTQAHIWATGPFTMAYGQNADTARTPGPPGGIDLGYVAIPGEDFVSLVLTVAKTASPQVVPTASGSVATFTIKVDSQKYTVDGVNVTDYLPPNWNYVAGTDTTTITRPDLTTVTGAPADPTKTGAGPYTLTWSSAQLGTTGTPGMATNQEVTITFTARTTAVLAVGTMSQNKVKAVGTRTFGTPSQTQTFTATDFAYVTSGAVTITKTSSATDPVSPGDRFTYTVGVANPSTSGVTLTNLSLYDALPAGVTNVAGTSAVSRASTIADAFGTAVYSNNDGTQNWTGNWLETDISGTTAGPTAGFVQVAGNALQFGYQASNVADNFTSAVYTRNDGNTNWVAAWTETGDDGAAATGTIRVNQAAPFTPLKVAFTRCGAAGCTSSITRSATISGGSATISFLLTNSSLAVNEYLEGDYSINGGTSWVPMQRITTGGVLSIPPGGCGNPCTISTAGAATLTVRFQETTRWAVGGHYAQVDNVNIAFNDSVGSAARRTANLTGATSATLNFTYGSANLAGTDTVVVQASNAAAGPFTTLATFTAGTPNVAPPYNLTTYISANTTIRFLVTGGINAPTKTFSVDNVTLAYNTSLAGANPPELVSSSSAYNLTPGETLTASFDVTVDNPLAAGIDTITNTASVTSTQLPIALPASVTNIVVNPSSGSAEVGDRVWLDSNGNGVLDIGEPGMANVEVTLKDLYGTPLMTATTDATGHYLFTGVEAGNGYYVEATSSTIPSGLIQSAATGSNNRTNTFTLAASQSYTNADLGYKPAAGTATIGDYVWSDANADNRRNAGEPGLAGVAVELWRDVNGNGIKDAGDALCTSGTCGTNGTTTTAPDGSYLFTGVTAGGTEDYIVYIDEAQAALSGYTRTSPPSGSALFSIINIASGASILYANFGYQGTTYSIKDRVWFDVNGDRKDDVTAGDNAEVGLSGVTVDLLDASLNAIATTTTDANGYFTFSGVIGGGADYTIKITDTDGKLTDYFGTTPAAIAGQKGVVNLAGNVDFTVEPTQPDFGYGLKGAIGSWVYNDANSNSTHDAGEGISGVTVKLYKDVNANGIINSPADTLVATLTTDSTGRYIFSGLANGSYVVSIESPPGGYAYFGTDSDTVTTGQQLPATISGGGNSLAIDFGYRASTPHSVSGTLWEDTDQDGVIDSGEVGISGVTIDLLNASLTVVATTTTDAYGSYSFNGIASGTPYYVKITDNDGVLTGYTGTWEKTELLTGPFNGQETVNLTSDRTGINFGYYNPVPTLVVVSYFGAYEKDGQVVVKWETASEINTLGFNLLRLNPLTGEYKQVNPGLLPSMLKPHRGGKYTFKDTGALPGKTNTYKLIEIEVNGNELSYGPFAVFPARITDDKGLDLSTNADYGRTERDKPEMHKVRTDGRKSRQPGNVKTGSGERIKISVTDKGIYYVDAKDISSLLGISTNKVPSMISQGQLSLSNQGKNVAYLPAANNAGLYFYGTGIDSIYTKENVYWLDKGAGTLIPVVKGTGPAPSPEGGSFTEAVHLEEDVIPWETLFNDPNVDYWFWNQIFASNFYTDPARSFTFQSLGPAPGTTAVIQVHLFGASDAGVTNDHHVVVSLNGQSAEGWWSGLTPYTITGTFPLQSGENTINVAATADEGVSSSFILIDSFDVTYKRLYDADGDNLFFRGDGAPSVTIGGFTSAGIKVFDLTNPIIPKFNTATTSGVSSAPGTASYTVSLKPASANTPYIAVASAGIKAASAKAASFSKLSAKQNSADYIVIAPSELVSTAQGLADYRAGQGMKTMVVNLEDIMNEFDYGISSPEAIKSFLSVAHSKWKKSPRYVVLAGDGSLDYKDNLGFGGNLIPSKLVPTDFGLAMSDNYLADINGDHLPEIAIGRLPVVNPDELNAVIGKIKTFERTLGNRSVILVADTPDNGGDFIAGSEALAGLFPSGYTVSRINLDDPAIVDAKRAALISAINQGAAFFNYVGHAGPDQLSNSGLLSHYPYPEYNPPTDDLPSLTNSTILPVMIAMTCGLNNFSDPYQDVLSEALLLKPDGGVAAAWSATGLSDDAQAGIFNREFYKAVFSGKEVLGDAVLQALSAYKKQGTMPFMMDTYCILGDPALRMR